MAVTAFESGFMLGLALGNTTIQGVVYNKGVVLINNTSPTENIIQKVPYRKVSTGHNITTNVTITFASV